MTDFTPQEQMLLEMANRARLDPSTEATKDGITLNQYIDTASSGSISADPRQVLAGSNALRTVAVDHDNQIVSSRILTQANFDPHNGAGDGMAVDRVTNAGFTLNPTMHYHPENFDYQWTTGQVTNAMTIQAGNDLFTDDPKNMFGEGGGHRLALLDPNIKEIGVGEVTVPGLIPNGQTVAGTGLVITENFGNDTTKSFLTGAVYNDAASPNAAANHFYDIGEGVQNVTETVKDANGTVIGTDVTGSGGGWSVAEPGGTYSVTFSGAGLATPVSALIEGGNLNAKVDLVSGREIDSSANATLLDGATGLRLLGIGNINGTGNAADNVIVGNAGNNILAGGGGNDSIDGGAGDDTAVFSGKQADYKITVNGGAATITDLRAGTPDGSDTITNIEHVKFADATINYSDLKTTVAPAPVAGTLSISDASITEGNSGSQIETFTVTRSGGNAAFDVQFATSDGTATTADGDYVAKSGVVHFDAGVITQTVSVVVNGDTKVEANETYKVTLSAATDSATIAHAQGTGTIVNDDAPAVHHVANDFNGDGISDALLSNTNGSLALWQFNGTQITSNTTVGSVAASWHVDGTGDFGNDGKADILLHSDSGQVALWQMNGDQIASNTTIGSIGIDWHVAGIADFNNDGKADILWENTKGQVAVWQMDGNHIVSNTIVGSIGTASHAIGTGDFNGDGKADILWENSKGQVAMWQMDGSHVTAKTVVGSIGTDWHAVGTADFNGDGKADILWENSKGQVAMWQMNGSHIASNTTVGSSPGSTVVATGDYNHDGKADVLLQNANGSVVQWQMNGDHITHSQTVASHSADWHLV